MKSNSCACALMYCLVWCVTKVPSFLSTLCRPDLTAVRVKEFIYHLVLHLLGQTGEYACVASALPISTLPTFFHKKAGRDKLQYDTDTVCMSMYVFTFTVSTGEYFSQFGYFKIYDPFGISCDCFRGSSWGPPWKRRCWC